MIIENGYGKSIFMSLDDYLDLDEKGWQYLTSLNIGDYIEEPFSKSCSFSNTSHSIDKLENEEDLLEIIDELPLDIIEELEIDLDKEIDYEDFDE